MLMWIAGAVLTGIVLGALGYFFSKAAYAIFMGAIPLYAFMSSTITGGTSGGLVKNVLRFFSDFGHYPSELQYGLLAFIISFFCTRIVTHFSVGSRKNATARRFANESKAERKTRILAEYGMN